MLGEGGSKSRALKHTNAKGRRLLWPDIRALGLAESEGRATYSHGFDYLVDGNPVVRVRAVAMPHIREEFDRRHTTRESGEDRDTTQSERRLAVLA